MPKKNPRATAKKAQIYSKIARSLQPRRKLTSKMREKLGRSTGQGRLT